MTMEIVDAKTLASKLNSGHAAIFPTDTLPALAVIPKYSYLLWELKKRPRNKPLILMGSDKEQLIEYVDRRALDDLRNMADTYWPGALTMVLPSHGKEVEFLNQGVKTIGIRVPDCIPVRKLLAQTGPLATTSVNLSGEPSVLTPEEAIKTFPGLPLLGPLPWPLSSGIASTVIEWQGLQQWSLLREGAVKLFGPN